MLNLPIENWLFGAAIGSLALTLPLSGMLPQWAKTMGLSTSFISSLGLVAIEGAGQNWKKYRQAQLDIQQAVTENQYGATDALNTAAADMQYKQALKEWIVLNIPIEGWEYWLGAYELTAIALPEIQAAREAIGLGQQPMIELEAEVIPKPQINQESVVDTVIRTIGESLDTEWFKQWAHENCGIICGQSGDGKSFLLCNVLLKEFLRRNSDAHGNLNAHLWICDPDYGSSHGDSPPNTWLGMPLDSVVYTEYKDIFNTVVHVSKEVDRRVQITKRAMAAGQEQPQFEPALLILDELPNIAAGVKDDREAFIDAIKNILRRGKKQNVLFKCGTQTLAVGSTHIPKEVLQQIEVVMLYSSAQVKDNYNNIGADPEDIEAVLKEIKPLPRKMGDKFVVVTYLDKRLQIAGIPSVKAVQIQDDVHTDQTPVAPPSPIEQQYSSLSEFYKALSDRLSSEFTDTQLMSAYQEMSEDKVRQENWDNMVAMLRSEIAKVRSNENTV